MPAPLEMPEIRTSLAVQRHATRVELGKGVCGYDATGGIVPAFGLQLVHASGHPGPNAIHRPLHTNRPGAHDQRGRVAAAAGLLQGFGHHAGVCIAAVDHHPANAREIEVHHLPVIQNRGGRELALRESSRGRAGSRAGNHRHVQIPGQLDAGRHPRPHRIRERWPGAPVYPNSPPTDLGCSLSRQGSRDAAPLNPVVQSEAAPSDRTKPGTSGVTRPPPSSISLLPSPTRPASWPPPDRAPRDSSGSRLFRRSDPRRLPRSLAAGVESPGSRSRPHLTPLSPSHSVQRTPPIPGGRQPQKGTSRLDF